MGFNANSFVKSATKTVKQRITSAVVNTITSKLPLNLLSSASSTADSLFNAGASFDSISALTSQKTDSLINKGSTVFYALAGKDPSRISSADLIKLRTSGNQDASFHIKNINPSTVIKNKRKQAGEAILGAFV